MTEDDHKNLIIHVNELEALATNGDEMAIKTLACMALLRDE